MVTNMCRTRVFGKVTIFQRLMPSNWLAGILTCMLLAKFAGSALATSGILSDSFTLDADLSGGDVTCAAGVPTEIAYGTEEQIPYAGYWQVVWTATYYVSFGATVPTSLQCFFDVYDGTKYIESVTYTFEPSLFQPSTTKEFSFAVGTRGNDGTNSGVLSSGPFLMPVLYFCTAGGASVTLKGDSHILQMIFPNATD